MLKNREELEVFYKDLTQNFEGYVQMSDSRIENIFILPTSLPKWEALHNSTNYIVEMALFDATTKNSILLRQQNNMWLVLEKVLKGSEPMDSFFTVTPNTHKMKIAQIWEEESNGFCLDMKVLEAKYLMFAGFEKGESK